MAVAQSTELINFFTSNFSTISLVNYEQACAQSDVYNFQVNMTDKFSQIMANNLHNRGIILPGLVACEDIETQKRRYFYGAFRKDIFSCLDGGFEHVQVWTMEQIYREFLDKNEIDRSVVRDSIPRNHFRIEKIEFLDEKELLSQLLDHYCIVYAVKESNSDLKNITPK